MSVIKIQGSLLSHPFRADARGTLATTDNLAQIIEESIMSICETRQGEDKMMPGYGIPDFVFDVVDAGIASRVAYWIQQQITYWEPLVKDVKVRLGEPLSDAITDDRSPLAEAHRVYINIEYTERDTNTRRNMVLPMWELIK